MKLVPKFLLFCLVASLVAVIAACSGIQANQFGFPTYGELESFTVQEYVNGEPVSREIPYDVDEWSSYDPDDLVFAAWSGEPSDLKKVDEEANADSSLALKYRLTMTDGSELEFFVYIVPQWAVYFQKADGELWRFRGDRPEECFTSAYTGYQWRSFRLAFEDQIETRSFQILPEYNGTGKALVIEDRSAVADDPDNGAYQPRFEFEDVYWDGWDGTPSLQLPHYKGYWQEDDYGAVRPEDVRYVVVYEAVDSEVDGYWVDSSGNYVSSSSSDVFVCTVYDLVTGQTATFSEGEDASIFDQVKSYINQANAQG